MKKLILNESQFKLIQNLILEGKFNDMVSNAEVGDTILIRYTKNNKLVFDKFEVLEYHKNGVGVRLLEKVKSNKRDNLIILNNDDLRGSDLELTYVVRPEGSSEIKSKPQTLIINNVSNIVLFSSSNEVKLTMNNDDIENEVNNSEDDSDTNKDDSNVSNSEEPEDNSDKESSDEDDVESEVSSEEVFNTILGLLSKLSLDEMYVLKLSNKSKIYFRVLDRDLDDVKIKIVKAKSESPGVFKSLINKDFNVDISENNVELNRTGDGVNIMFQEVSNDDDSDLKEINIKDIEDIDHLNQASDDDTVGAITPQEAYNIMKLNPVIKDFISKSPSLADSITNREPEGFAKLIRILNKVQDRGVDFNKPVSSFLKVNQKIKFRLLGKSIKGYVNDELYTLKSNSTYYGVNKHRRGDKVEALVDKLNGVWLRFKSVVDEDDSIFLADIVVKAPDASTKKIGEGNIKIY